MIEGRVDAYRQPVLELAVQGPTGHEERLEFIVDTGFEGAITLHSSIAAALNLKPIGAGRAWLADGSETVFDICEAVLPWGDTRRPVFVEIADTVPLLGMAVLQGHELVMQVIPNGILRITSLPDVT